ncbi:bile acid:sodium symporter family protein [Aequorivita marina]|uniref:bile acid:sodium symporter family protein n=1 Tax=Aequorivita marina TaxID=3073654 RepID=UPI002875EFCD|nr:bile acid:sodium symporter family protein [Aequorivita sp. S2608]MDS1297230.1 bile acid:sodium symporter family protein [Aequorivita sp. S2608]
MLNKIKIDSFVLAIVISITLAYFLPQLGASDSPVPMRLITSLGISLIFFFYGLNLNSEAIKNGLKNWRLHLTVQSSTFILFPLLILPFFPVFKDTSYELLWLAFLFMAALPSTVSSSVVMVSMAKGNLPAAIFNASISGIIGIILTPLWMMPFIKQTTVAFDFSAIYGQLATEIVIPLILGLLLRKYLSSWAQKHKRELSLFDKFIILLIIYKSFVQSFEDNIFSSITILEMLAIVAVVLVLFFIVYSLTGWFGKLLNFNHADRITNQFCGTKKSLVHGTVFSEALFGQTNIIGIILLPLMLYHAFQILIISVIATKKGKQSVEGNKTT